MGSGQSCPRVNTTIPENGAQWSLSSGEWGNVKLGWLIAGISTLITTTLCVFATCRHARHYHRPKEQRQIIRILWMPFVFSIICFFAYRYYRHYIYYKLIVIVYESFCLMAFLALMLAYVGSSTEEQMRVMQSKDKRPLPWPFGCLRYRPSKPYFLYALNGSVVQYAFIRPIISIIAMICEASNVLCAHKLSLSFAHLYLEVVDFTSISIALFGLALLYSLVKERLQGKRPMTKFLVVKLVVAVTYYQAFLFSAMVSNGVLKANAYWSKSNIADGLNAIVICVEMVLVSAAMFWAFPAAEYIAMTKQEGRPPTKAWRAIGQALNFSDFVMEAWRGMMYFINWRRSRSKADDPEEDGEANPPAGKDRDTNLDINAAFNGSRLTQSALTTQLVKSGSQGPRIQPLLYGSIEEKSTSGSYLEKNEYFRGESDPDLARQNNASSTQVIAPAPATVNASTYDSSTAYQEAQIYLAPAQVPASISTLVPVGHAETSRQAPAQGIEPTSEPVTAPRDLPPCRRSLSRPHHAPSTGHPVSVGDGKIAISQSESENSTGALGSLAEIPMDASTEVSKDVYPAHLFRPEGERPSFIENSMPLASVHASGVARLRQLESDKPWLTSLEGEQDSRHSRGNSQIIEEYMLSPAEGIDAVEAQRQPESDTAGSDLSFFTLPETAPLSPIKF